MTQKARTLAGLLLAMLLCVSLPLTMAASTGPATAHHSVSVYSILTLLALVGGTTVFYTFPNGGPPWNDTGVTTLNGTTAPTAGQAANFSTLSIKFQMLDSETSCTFTHNWNLSGTATNEFFPVPIVQGFGAGTAGQTFAVFNFTYGVNTLVATKTSGVGTGGTFSAVLLKPHSLMR